MARILVSLIAVGFLLGGALLISSNSVAATTTRVSFGMDASAVAPQSAAGVKPDYGTFWIGPWTLNSGWGAPDTSLSQLKSQGVTPAVHFYYWGDDISPSCVENGCWSSLHGVRKDRAHWNTLARQMTDHLNAKMGGKPVVVFLESEFNKGGISTYEPFDGYLATMAYGINARYPAAIVVLGFGNWDSSNWGTFNRAAAAAEMVGLQGMRGSTKDSASEYNGLYTATLSGVRKLQTLFHKPIMLTDIALSSYPEPSYSTMQAENLKKFFTGMQALKDAGVRSMIYRSWRDSPGMDLANYYGQAERHWGLAHATSAGGTNKPAAQVWINGVKAERGSTASSTTTTSTSGTTFAATFTPKGTSNDWWVETGVSANAPISKVDARVNGGAWTVLSKTSWGTYAESIHVLAGQKVEFRATSSTGATSTSAAYTWS